MTVFTIAELSGLQAAQEEFMQDACQVGTRSSSQDALGEMVDSFIYGSAIACGFQMTGGLQSSEFRTADGTVVYADAMVRLPHGAAVGVTDLVKVTKRQGTSLTTALVYEVMGRPLVGVTGVVCYLRAVST